MKKFTFMLIAAFVAVMSWAAPLSDKMVKKAPMQLVGQMKTSARQATPKKPAPVRLQAPVNNRMVARAKTGVRKAPRKAGIADLLSKQWMLCSDYYEYESGLVGATPAAGGTVIGFSMLDATTIGIDGFISDATETVQATFTTSVDADLQAEGIVAVVSIPDGQTLIAETDDGPVLLMNCSEDKGTPLTAYVYSDGYVEIKDLWAAVIGGDGEYAGYLYSYYNESWVVPVNGTMSWGEGEEAVAVPVVINQDEEHVKYVTVYNFGGYETAVSVTLKEDKAFTIPQQEMYYDSSVGYVYLSGITSDYYIETLSGVGTENTLTFNGNWMLFAGEDLYSDVYNPATITLTDGEFAYPVIPDVAAIPAAPEMMEVGNYDAGNGYGYVVFNILTTDVDGKELKEEKLYYQLYSDIDGDIQPITFTTDLYIKISEDMSIIPYTFTDSYDFDEYKGSKLVYLNYNFNSMYDRIGVKSIYTGGGETNESAIVWIDVEKEEEEETTGVITFNFNEMDVPVSSNVAKDGDIKETLELTEGVVTLAISPKEEGKTTENRFWSTSAGPQLRVYSGTLTFSVAGGQTIKKIAFYHNGKWGNNTVDGVVIDNDTEASVATWTGDAQAVVVAIAANSQINSIEVSLNGDDELVVLPEGVEPEVWALEGFYGNGSEGNDVFRTTEVAFDGNDVYVKGLAYYFEDAWLKGTLDAETGIVTFPSGQLVGEDEEGKEYMVGYDDDICDIRYVYDAEAKTLTQVTAYVMESQTKSGLDEEGELAYWGVWSVSYFHAGDPLEVKKVEVPEGLETTSYFFSANELVEEGEEPLGAPRKNAPRKAMTSQPYSCQLQVGFDGQDVYFKGFSDDTSDMWAKGTLSEDGKTVTIPACQFLGTIESWFSTYDFYLTAVDADGESFEDIIFNYDAETNTFSTDQTIMLNGSMFVFYPYQTFTNVAITKMQEFAATPADPSIDSYTLEGVSYPYIEFVIPTQDTEGNTILASKLFYTVWVEQDGAEQPFTVRAGEYKYVNEDWTEVPYDWDDSYDIYKGGSKFYFNPTDVVTSWKKIGIQSIYYGGDERHTSNIVWMENPTYEEPTGIAHVNARTDNKTVVFDLQGRRVAAPTKGLYIVNGKKVVLK